mgnify:FL=1
MKKMNPIEQLTDYLNKLDEWSNQLSKLRKEAREKKNELEIALGMSASRETLDRLNSEMHQILINLQQQLNNVPEQ